LGPDDRPDLGTNRASLRRAARGKPGQRPYELCRYWLDFGRFGHEKNGADVYSDRPFCLSEDDFERLKLADIAYSASPTALRAS
jgi:hypothetical protein